MKIVEKKETYRPFLGYEVVYFIDTRNLTSNQILFGKP